MDFQARRDQNLRDNQRIMNEIMGNLAGQTVQRRPNRSKKKKADPNYTSSAKPSNDGGERELRNVPRVDYKKLAGE